MDDQFHYEVAVRDADRCTSSNRSLDTVVASASRKYPVVLRIETRPHPHGPDVVVLGFEGEDGVP
jgi:hypothetical protein